jgi:hypothetical protein
MLNCHWDKLPSFRDSDRSQYVSVGLLVRRAIITLRVILMAGNFTVWETVSSPGTCSREMRVLGFKVAARGAVGVLCLQTSQPVIWTWFDVGSSRAGSATGSSAPVSFRFKLALVTRTSKDAFAFVTFNGVCIAQPKLVFSENCK